MRICREKVARAKPSPLARGRIELQTRRFQSWPGVSPILVHVRGQEASATSPPFAICETTSAGTTLTCFAPRHARRHFLSPRDGRSATRRLEGRQGLFDPPFARLGLLRAVDGPHVLLFSTVGQPVVGGAGGGIGIKGAREVTGYVHRRRLGIKRQLDLVLLAGRD